jgi:hypothetical protein
LAESTNGYKLTYTLHNEAPMMQTETSGELGKSKPVKPRPAIQTIAVSQDGLLRQCVRLIEEAHADRHFTWSWLSKQSHVSTTTVANWRKKKTKSGLTRTMNAALRPLGYRLVIGKLK